MKRLMSYVGLGVPGCCAAQEEPLEMMIVETKQTNNNIRLF
jgi:hypothetical protein